MYRERTDSSYPLQSPFLRTFSSFSCTGGGFDLVTALQNSSPNSNASFTDFPGNRTKTESVSPYTQRQPYHLPSFLRPHWFAKSMAFLSVRRAHSTIVSANIGIEQRPEKVAEAGNID